MTAKETDELKTDHIWSGIMMYGLDKKRFNEELNEHINSKLKRVIKELNKKIEYHKKRHKLNEYTAYEHEVCIWGLEEAIEIIEKELI